MPCDPRAIRKERAQVRSREIAHLPVSRTCLLVILSLRRRVRQGSLCKRPEARSRSTGAPKSAHEFSHRCASLRGERGPRVSKVVPAQIWSPDLISGLPPRPLEAGGAESVTRG